MGVSFYEEPFMSNESPSLGRRRMMASILLRVRQLEIIRNSNIPSPIVTTTGERSISIQDWLETDVIPRAWGLSTRVHLRRVRAEDEITTRLSNKNSHVKHLLCVRSLKSRVFEPELGITSIKSLRQRPHNSLKRHQRHRIRRESPINLLVGTALPIMLPSAP